jgi:predicted enzyme related to lactoylglutathione lyase
MTRIETYPPGVPCFVDALTDDLASARAFYSGIFGWEFAGPGPMPSGAGHEYWLARARGHDVAGLGSRPDPGTPTGWTTHVAVTSADETTDLVRDAGGVVIAEPFDVAPAGRMAVVADPAGAALVLWQAGARAGAGIVNEHSAWSMSLLATADPEAVAPFYAQAFGWVAEPFTDAGPGVFLFRLPGYVGGEPGQPVPRDVVAAAMTAADRPAQWSVEFWIDDADAAAAAAAGLGGTVLQEPIDVPMFRRAVLAAPDGAAFTISELRLPAR